MDVEINDVNDNPASRSCGRDIDGPPLYTWVVYRYCFYLSECESSETLFLER